MLHMPGMNRMESTTTCLAMVRLPAVWDHRLQTWYMGYQLCGTTGYHTAHRLPHGPRATTWYTGYHKVRVTTRYTGYYTVHELPHGTQVTTRYTGYHKVHRLLQVHELPHRTWATKQYTGYHIEHGPLSSTRATT